LQCGREGGIAEPNRGPALDLLDQHSNGEVILIAPDVLLAEFASLLAKGHRQKRISAAQAHDAYSLMETYGPELFETRLRLRRALALSLEYHLSLWDCIYLALAEEFECPVLTADPRLFRGAGGRHPSIQLVRQHRRCGSPRPARTG
jgi:predicted nucleic acid-binding protein